MELKEGMYVRTNKGIIDKIVDIRYGDNYNNEPFIVLLEKTKGYIEQKESNVKEIDGVLTIDDDIKTYWILANEIIKASNELIDLIEVGDYVNGYKITTIEEEDKKIKFILGNEEQYYGVYKEDIKSIVTKEQFEQMKYVVK